MILLFSFHSISLTKTINHPNSNFRCWLYLNTYCSTKGGFWKTKIFFLLLRINRISDKEKISKILKEADDIDGLFFNPIAKMIFYEAW